MKTTIKTVTPSIAEEYLKTMVRNRSCNPRTVSAYAQDMRNGNWFLTHQGIAFNSSGRLVDGQHRLRAVIESGADVEMMVTTGLEERRKNGVVVDAMDGIDRHRPRSIGAQLQISHGIKNANAVAALARGIVCFWTSDNYVMTTAETLHVLKIYGSDIDALMAIPDFYRAMPSVIASPVIVLHNTNPGVSCGFASAFCSLDGGKNSPAMALRRWLGHHPNFRQILTTTRGVVASALKHYSESSSVTKLYGGQDAIDWIKQQQKANERKIAEIIGLG